MTRVYVCVVSTLNIVVCCPGQANPRDNTRPSSKRWRTRERSLVLLPVLREGEHPSKQQQAQTNGTESCPVI